MPRVLTLTPDLTNSKIMEMIRIARFGPNNENLRCPRCGSPKVVKYGKEKNRPYVQRYKCLNCKRTFNDLTGTPMEGSKLTPREWVLIAYLFLKLGLSVLAIARELGKPYPTIYKTVEKIKKHAVWFQRPSYA